MEMFMKMRFLISLIVLASILIGFSCTKKVETPAPKKEVAPTQKMVDPIIDITQAKKLLEEGAVFIDNRPEKKFMKGHIKGAVNLPFFTKGHPTNVMTKENLLKAVNGKKTVVFYCSGHKRAFHALNQAKEWEINAKLYWYKAGFREWKKDPQ
jgi:3-mercaptopyruvate sulfurtransferase SseA